ncbi:MAG: winged helix-turn-helix transcriptional regulator [Chloroflexi bacterium]|nr:winged helix-turn-helix transcriptional regulator [Chloroflexota bacterium]
MTDYDYFALRLKLLAHPERLRILDILRYGPQCVCHFVVELGRSQPYISQQVRILHRAGVLQAERRGLNIYYSIVDSELLSWLDCILGPVDSNKMKQQRLSDCECPKCR